MDQALQDLGDYIAAALPDAVREIELKHDELAVLARRNSIRQLLKFLRDDSQTQFKVLVDLCGADYPDREERFEIVYNLLSVKHNQRIRVKLSTDESTPVPTAVGLFSCAGWLERETWDLYGVFFEDHPDLRRLLTDYGFEGHPLRKNFPLTGHVEVRYDQQQKRVVYDPVKLTQDFRTFDFLSPWEGVTRHLPGDEKAEAQPAEGESNG